MLQTYKVTVDHKGDLKLPKNLVLPSGSQVLVTILDESAPDSINDEGLLSEKALAEDWDKPEEDEAWESLQPEQ